MSFAAAIPLLGPVINKILDFIPDKNAREKAEAEFNRAVLEATIKEGEDQRDINRQEAQHQSLFVAGWRPFIGWVCGIAIAFQFMVRPFWAWASGIWWPEAPVPPGLDEMLWELVFAMLGISSLRTVEKLKGPRGK